MSLPSLRRFFFTLVLLLSGAAVASHAAPAATLIAAIKIDAMAVTKAELRRHMAAPEGDPWRPATFADLEASKGAAQPDYLVVRFLTPTPAHFSGEADAKIDGNRNGIRLNVVLHYNKGWVEYFLPLDGLAWRTNERDGNSIRVRPGSPAVIVDWVTLQTK